MVRYQVHNNKVTIRQEVELPPVHGVSDVISIPGMSSFRWYAMVLNSLTPNNLCV